MFRLWGKIIKKNKIRESFVFESNETLDKDKLVKLGLEEICYHFNLSVPMWLEDNTKHMKKFSSTKFYRDHFIEEIDFDCLEIEIIEVDKKKN